MSSRRRKSDGEGSSQGLRGPGCYRRAQPSDGVTHGGLSSWSNLVLPAGLDVRLQARWTRDAQSNGHSQANGHAKINGQLRRSEQEALEALENLGKVAEKAQELPDPILDRIQHWQDQPDRARRSRVPGPAGATCGRAHAGTVGARDRATSVATEGNEADGTGGTEGIGDEDRGRALPAVRQQQDRATAPFELNLAGLLPPQLAAAIACLSNGPIDKRFGMIPMLVDLFDPSTGPKYGLAG